MNTQNDKKFVRCASVQKHVFLELLHSVQKWCANIPPFKGGGYILHTSFCTTAVFGIVAHLKNTLPKNMSRKKIKRVTTDNLEQVKDRIRFGAQHGTGVPTVDRFSDKTADQFERHGFDFLGRITIDTDVVRENAQTYRLGWTENSKDSTKMGCGMSEYVLILRKPQTDRSRAYADVPVTKDKSIYLRADWQVDAAGLWKSNGNRLPDPDIMQNMPLDAVRRLWEDHCHKHGYDWQEHVEVARAMEDKGYLPATWMLFAPISNNPSIWTDIIRMRILRRDNMSEDQQKKFKNHCCPLQIDIVDRLIGRYSNPGEIVFDPFAGIGTVPYRAQNLGRIGWGCELATEYWTMGVGFCEQAEQERIMPTLFDLSEHAQVIEA